jgi:cation:H+ antiporter
MAFENVPIWLNLLVFAASAAVVWGAGTKLAIYVSGIAERTGAGHAFMGMVMLGGITSLPEAATVASASYVGNPQLAVNNLLGSASVNVVLLAVADGVLGRSALTSVVAKPSTLLQGVLGVLLLAAVAAAITVGDIELLGFGLWSSLLLAGCIAALWLASRYEGRQTWQVVDDHRRKAGGTNEPKVESSLRQLTVRTTAAAGFILVAGFLLAGTGDAIATQSGLGTGIVGFALVGFATSLPEMSAAVSAVRIGRYEMAVGDVFGTNIVNIALIFLADVVYDSGPVLALAGSFETLAALLGIALTGIFLVGLLERENRTVFKMGYDSLAAIAVYVVGLIMLFSIE